MWPSFLLWDTFAKAKTEIKSKQINYDIFSMCDFEWLIINAGNGTQLPRSHCGTAFEHCVCKYGYISWFLFSNSMCKWKIVTFELPQKIFSRSPGYFESHSESYVWTIFLTTSLTFTTSRWIQKQSKFYSQKWLCQWSQLTKHGFLQNLTTSVTVPLRVNEVRTILYITQFRLGIF